MGTVPLAEITIIITKVISRRINSTLKAMDMEKIKPGQTET
jgi:hypothetical protein